MKSEIDEEKQEAYETTASLPYCLELLDAVPPGLI